MKEVYKTKEGTYTDSVKKVFLSDDGAEYSNERAAILHDKLGFMPKMYPNQIKIQGEVFKYAELNPWDNVLEYSMYSWNHEKVFFSIESDGSYIFKEFQVWDRCSEQDVSSHKEDTPLINGVEVNECQDINFSDADYADFESLFNLR